MTNCNQTMCNFPEYWNNDNPQTFYKAPEHEDVSQAMPHGSSNHHQ